MFEKGDFVWLPCESKAEFSVALGGQVIDVSNGQYLLIGDDDKEYYVPHFVKLRHMHASSKDGVEDMISLGELNECSILRNLRLRYNKQQIYTYTGSILIAMNPYQKLAVFTQEYMDLYRNKRIGELPPHLFAIGDNALFNLKRFRCNQCIIISGESGAGKTESTKLLLKYLTMNSDSETLIEKQILNSNPILEAFGNAQTARNDNSSRFGKYIEVRFNLNEGGKITGAFVEQYLLEKSRLVCINNTEHNYHIFYSLLYGASHQYLQSELGLEPTEQYFYLNNTDHSQQQYASQFSQILSSAQVLGFSDSELNDIWKITSLILHLGNIHFESLLTEHTEGSVISKSRSSSSLNLDVNHNETKRDHLSWAASLLQVPMQELRDALTQKVLQTGCECVTAMRTCSNAVHVRNALAKTIYGQLFSWLVGRINHVINQHSMDVTTETSFVRKNHGVNSIGILDIFGFENFDLNSFEQLCINYANENLQQFFVRHIFKIEQEEYVHEGLMLSAIEFTDNQAALDLIAIKPMNLISIIDEEGRFPQGTDQTMLYKMVHNHQHNPLFVKPLSNNLHHFSIQHFAGTVRYDVLGFLEKSRDIFSADLALLMSKSESVFISKLFEEKLSKKKELRKLAPSLGLQFKRSLGRLMTTLMRCTPFFVRCVKPNEFKSPNLFDHELCARQLRYAGMMETIRIRKSGFPIRHAFADFVRRYRVVLIHANILARKVTLKCGFKDANRKSNSPNWSSKPLDFLTHRQLDDLATKDLKQLTRQICELTLNSNDFCLGHTKVFLKVSLGFTFFSTYLNYVN
ncbi:hypothetical protein Ciccas_001677 [Cichlidogyrus casuarinus]|uniref:Myosin motor domain-containing protein n=1 Tax=Cichlidogyrus casuarinus TaxID=1844966 RepID=A0ABD2QJL0_9PLAT